MFIAHHQGGLTHAAWRSIPHFLWHTNFRYCDVKQGKWKAHTEEEGDGEPDLTSRSQRTRAGEEELGDSASKIAPNGVRTRPNATPRLSLA